MMKSFIRAFCFALVAMSCLCAHATSGLTPADLGRIAAAITAPGTLIEKGSVLGSDRCKVTVSRQREDHLTVTLMRSDIRNRMMDSISLTVLGEEGLAAASINESETRLRLTNELSTVADFDFSKEGELIGASVTSYFFFVPLKSMSCKL